MLGLFFVSFAAKLSTIVAMKKSLKVEDAKELVGKLLGRDVDVKLNRGRNKIRHYVGVISEAHQNVFVISLANDVFDRLSCSYIDLVCGDVALRERG